jgi:S-DNA-T family DNA segregation ATPase FtsK/SpoIIIE
MNLFMLLRQSPWLYAPIVYPDERPVSDVLTDLMEEMEGCYRLMSATSSDTLAEHIRRTGEAVPRIVCVCDEYADLVLGDRAERRAIEQQIARLGSKARAASIHLMLAT